MSFQLIADPTQVGRVLAAVKDAGGPVGIDTETTGLDPTRGRIRLIQLAMPRDTFLIDLFALPGASVDLKPIFGVLARREIIGHNLGFDLQFRPAVSCPARVRGGRGVRHLDREQGVARRRAR